MGGIGCRKESVAEASAAALGAATAEGVEGVAWCAVDEEVVAELLRCAGSEAGCTWWTEMTAAAEGCDWLEAGSLVVPLSA